MDITKHAQVAFFKVQGTRLIYLGGTVSYFVLCSSEVEG